MKNLLTNKKILLILAVVMIIIFAIVVFFITQKRTPDDKSPNDLPGSPTIIPSKKPVQDRLILPMKDDDPRRWLDKDGNRIRGDNLTE